MDLYPTIAEATLTDALGFGGGSGIEGGARILLRHAVAALLNAAHPEVSYPRSVGDVLGAVDAALASQNRGTMLDLADELEADNEGECSLDTVVSKLAAMALAELQEKMGGE